MRKRNTSIGKEKGGPTKKKGRFVRGQKGEWGLRG